MGRCTDLRKNGDLDDERHKEERLAEPPDRQKIPADTRSTGTPVSKDSAADKVSADPVQRRSKGLKRGCPTEAALDCYGSTPLRILHTYSVVDRAPVVLPDPPDLQRRRSSEGERPAKSPDDKPSPEDTLPADPVVCKDLVAGVALYDPPHGSKDHGEERTVKPPDEERRVVDAVTNDSDSRICRADHIFDEASERPGSNTHRPPRRHRTSETKKEGGKDLARGIRPRKSLLASFDWDDLGRLGETSDVPLSDDNLGPDVAVIFPRVLLEQLSIGRKTSTLRGPLISTEV
ncbi:hypothetical protein E4U14_007757 [Claviceps sp. LM454 group G7]|nr:hypothetical protein E4U14_007757 [Claviceps sp. LM454 group G7]